MDGHKDKEELMTKIFGFPDEETLLQLLFAFVKPSLSHLRVLELECWISPETSFVFSMSNHPHFYLVQRHLNNKTNCTLHMFNFHLKKIF